MAQQNFTVFCQYDISACSAKKRDTQFQFQHFYGMGKRGLRYMKCLCGMGKMLHFRCFLEVRQREKCESHKSSLGKYLLLHKLYSSLYYYSMIKKILHVKL